MNAESQAWGSPLGPVQGTFCFGKTFAQKHTAFEVFRKEERGGGQERKRKLAIVFFNQADFLSKTLLSLMMCQHSKFGCLLCKSKWAPFYRCGC